MGAPISPARREQLVQCIADGFSVLAASKRVGISYSCARGIAKGLDGAPEDMRKAAKMAVARDWSEPVPYEELCPEAREALDDITLFARRYFGYILMPWHIEATERVVDLWATDRKEFVVINLPPGVGKSTFFTLVLPAWLTCRDRNIRGLIGSASDTTAKWYTGRLRDAFTATERVVASDDDKRHGRAVDAESTLLKDFGLFKPDSDSGGQWTQAAFDVRTLSGQRRGEKEHTWSSFGKGQTFIGSRVPFTIWDDVYSKQDNRTPEARAALNDWWKSTAESRLEPGGLCILQGQRLDVDDIYAYALGMESGGVVDIYADGLEEELIGAPEEDDGRAGKKYHHIVFKAHYEDRCKGDCTACKTRDCGHTAEQVHGDPAGKHCNGDGTHCRFAPPYPAGCLLYPSRLPWAEIATLMKDPVNFRIVYQQENVAAEKRLIEELHLTGGIGDDGTHHPGCYDVDREMGEVPRHLKGPFKRFAVIDPSPEKFWAIEDWLYDEDTQQRFLIRLHRDRMRIPDLLTSGVDGRLGGLMPQWQAQSMFHDVPIGAWVYERNSGNRFIMQIPEVDKFIKQFGVDVVAHDTYANKTDPAFGVGSIAPHYKHGRVRLPWKGEDTRRVITKMVDELVNWPDYRTDDTVMAHWFFEFSLPRMSFNVGYNGMDDAPAFDTIPNWVTGRTA